MDKQIGMEGVPGYPLSLTGTCFCFWLFSVRFRVIVLKSGVVQTSHVAMLLVK